MLKNLLFSAAMLLPITAYAAPSWRNSQSEQGGDDVSRRGDETGAAGMDRAEGQKGDHRYIGQPDQLQ